MNVLLDEDATDKNVLAGCGVQEVSRDQQKAVYVLNWNLLPEMLPASKKNSRETIVLAFPVSTPQKLMKTSSLLLRCDGNFLLSLPRVNKLMHGSSFIINCMQSFPFTVLF